MSLSKPDWAPFVDWTEMEWSSPEAARRNNFGVIAGGPLAERFRVFCRQRFFWMQQREPHCCAVHYKITVGPEARYEPEMARLEYVHVSPCPRATP